MCDLFCIYLNLHVQWKWIYNLENTIKKYLVFFFLQSNHYYHRLFMADVGARLILYDLSLLYDYNV